MRFLSKKLTMLVASIALLTSFNTNIIVSNAATANNNGGVFDSPFNITPSSSENSVSLSLVPNTTESTNENVTITAYGSQTISYIVRYAKVKIPIFELAEGNKNVTGTAKITIPDLNVTLVGNGSGNGSVSGYVSGTVSGSASGSVSGSYSSYPWYGSGSGSVSGSVSGTVGGNVAGTINIPLSGNIQGTVTSPGQITGTTDVNIPTYELHEKESKEYNVPYVIPIYTEIIDPNGNVRDGNMAKYTATSNGNYNFTIRDSLGNVATKSITVNNIDKGNMYAISYTIKKQYSNGSTIKSISADNIDSTGTVRAYTLASDTRNLNTTYGFYLKIKESSSKLNVKLLEENGGIGLPVVEKDIGITPEAFYEVNTSTETTGANVASKFPSLVSLADGIYIGNPDSSGYRTVFVKNTQPKLTNSTRIMNLSIENNAGTVLKKTFKVEIEDKPAAIVTAKYNYILSDDGLSTLYLTSESKPNLSLLTEVYDLSSYKSQVSLRKTGTQAVTFQEPLANISNSFKDISIRDFTVSLNRDDRIQSFDVNTTITNLNNINNPIVAYDNGYKNNLTVVYKPTDTMLDLSDMVRTPSSNNTQIKLTARLKSIPQIQELITKYNLKESDFKIALVDYSNIGGTNIYKLNDLNNLDNALKGNYSKSLGYPISASFKTGSDVRLVFGIPNKFVDTLPLTSNLNVSLYNISASDPVVQNVSETEPFGVNISVDSNEYKYSIPRDLEKIKNDGEIKSLLITIDNITSDALTLSEESIKNMLNITSEGIYNISVTAINKYNEKAIDSKKLILINGESLKNSARLKNDPSILLTKDGLYDIHSKKLVEYGIPHSMDSDNGISLKGIRLSNNNIVIVNTLTGEGQVYSSTLESLGIFKFASRALDIIQYGDYVLIANGDDGISTFKADKLESIVGKVLPKESTIDTPVYCLERLNSMLLVGGNGDKALRVYINNPDGGYTLKESLTASEIFDGSSNTVSKMTVRNNKLELYPGQDDYYVIIELP